MDRITHLCFNKAMRVRLESFEGPLSLLLYLIRREEMNIMDINIHYITHQYLNYIKAMKELDLELAGEFIAMAATLLHIKSRMLLPQTETEEEEEDPRKTLVEQLLIYEKFQKISEDLKNRIWVGRDVWLRGHEETETLVEEGDILLEDKGLFPLIKAYRTCFKRAKKHIHKVWADIQSVGERILELKDILPMGQTRKFQELLKQETPPEQMSSQMVVTFLSLLELGKLGFVSLYQSQPYSDIYVQTKKPIEENILQNIDQYDVEEVL